jgi:outer membrane protein assembly factor BamB
MWALNAADCSRKWMYNGFGDPPGSEPLVGSWSPPAYATDVNGRTLVVFGSSSPEGAVYALDALTGARVWRFPTQHRFLDEDVGAGPTISAPGVNGLADGAVYVGGKDNIFYALNLRTGAKTWELSVGAIAGTGVLRSTAALVGTTLYVGYGRGVLAVDAVTGAKVWSTQDHGLTTAEVVSSPAVTGAPGSQVVLVADVGGKVYAFKLSDGTLLWSYDAGQLIYSSPGVAAGAFYLTSENGFLYSFAPGGGTSGRPDTATTFPTGGATIPNPSGSLTFSGTATDDAGVGEVRVGIRLNGKWWNAATGSWGPVYTGNSATLGSPGARSTSWSLTFPAPSIGGPGQVLAEAVDLDGQHDPSFAVTGFRVAPTGNPPETTIAAPVFKQIFFFQQNPDGSVRRVSFPVSISGTAADSAGARPGVKKVLVVVQNIEHSEYYCGRAGCPGQPGVFWRAAFTSFAALLTAPNATSTGWNTTFPVYDHPHRYRIWAWAVDLENKPDTSRASVARICVRDPADTVCH